MGQGEKSGHIGREVPPALLGRSGLGLGVTGFEGVLERG